MADVTTETDATDDATDSGAEGADEQARAVSPGADVEGTHGHPDPAAYVGIAVILAIATAAEIALFYLEDELSTTLNTVLLLVLMVVKFFLVALWFMHLRFEARIFRNLFYGGIALAVAVYAVVLGASHVFPVLV